MKKINTWLIVILLHSYSIISFSQTYLTNGQVYDFEVGDIIQGRGSSGGGYPTFDTKTILSKTFSTKNDSIFYKIKIDYRQIQSPSTILTSSDTILQIITKLEEAVNQLNQTTCAKTQDSVYRDFGNRLVWEIHPLLDTSNCVEVTTETTKVIEGIGGPFLSLFQSAGPLYSEYTLIYYKKGSASWGTIVNNVKEFEDLKSEIEIFPNPTHDKIYIHSLVEVNSFDIFDITGQVCYSNNILNNTIDFSTLKPGFYFINFYRKDLKVLTKKILKQ